jgi:hypothetical protein
MHLENRGTLTINPIFIVLFYLQMSINGGTITTITQILIFTTTTFTIKCFVELKSLHPTSKSLIASNLKIFILITIFELWDFWIYMNVWRSWRRMRGRRWRNEKKKYCHFGPWPYHQQFVQLMPTNHATCPQKNDTSVFFVKLTANFKARDQSD